PLSPPPSSALCPSTTLFRSSASADVTITDNAAATGPLSIVSPLTLDKTTVNPGQTLNATVTYKNTGGSAVTVNSIVIAGRPPGADRKSTRLNSSHVEISYAV